MTLKVRQRPKFRSKLKVGMNARIFQSDSSALRLHLDRGYFFSTNLPFVKWSNGRDGSSPTIAMRSLRLTIQIDVTRARSPTVNVIVVSGREKLGPALFPSYHPMRLATAKLVRVCSIFFFFATCKLASHASHFPLQSERIFQTPSCNGRGIENWSAKGRGSLTASSLLDFFRNRKYLETSLSTPNHVHM